jgi:hypothetical protein
MTLCEVIGTPHRPVGLAVGRTSVGKVDDMDRANRKLLILKHGTAIANLGLNQPLRLSQAKEPS